MYEIPGTYERVIERIDSGLDVVYIPDIGLDKTIGFQMFVMPYNADYKTGEDGKYGFLEESDEIDLDTQCRFTYYDSVMSQHLQ